MPIPKAAPVFPRTEYLRRVASVKAEMARRGLGVLVVNQPANLTYLLGYTSKSGYVPQGLVISADREEPVFVLRRMDAPAAVHQTWLSDGSIIGYAEGLIGNPEQDGFDAVIDCVLELGLGGGALGLEPAYLSSQAVEKFKRRIPQAKVDDCSKVVAWLRGIKSELEIVLMREAAANADAAIARAGELIRPGVREADVSAELYATLIRGVNGKPGTDVASFFFCATPRTGTCHFRWMEDSLQAGSQVNLELAGVRHGYTAAVMRTFSVGAPSDRLRRLHDAQQAGLEAALAVVRPGSTCGEVASAFNRRLAQFGYRKESRCGYAIGIDWTEPTASLKEGDTTELKPNMTFHLMLGNWIEEDFGHVISETFRVSDTGVEVLTRSPRGLIVV